MPSDVRLSSNRWSHLDPTGARCLPEPEAAALFLGASCRLVELLPHAFAITANHARHPVMPEWRRTLLVTFLSVHEGPEIRGRCSCCEGLAVETSMIPDQHAVAAQRWNRQFFAERLVLQARRGRAVVPVEDGPPCMTNLARPVTTIAHRQSASAEPVAVRFSDANPRDR